MFSFFYIKISTLLKFKVSLILIKWKVWRIPQNSHNIDSLFNLLFSVQFSCSVMSDWLFATPWTAACQASLSITNSWSLPKLMSIKSGMPSNHLILCCPLLHLPSIFPSIRFFSNGSAFHIRWPKYWSFSFNISPSKEHPGLVSFRTDWLDPLNRGLGDYLCIVLIFHNQGIIFKN